MKKQDDMFTLDQAFDFVESLVENITEPASKKADREDLPDPVEWIETYFIDPVTEKIVVLAEHQKRIIREALRMDENGYSVYDHVIWSEPKKSGKTTAAAAVGCYVACNVEAPNEVSCVANDKEQSAGRIFGAMMPTLESLGWRLPPTQKGRLDDPMAFGPNKSFVHAITTNAGKEAGANQGLSLWSELWAYTGERLTLLWEEMTPPPTRKFRMRWVESYAGFKNQNLLYQSLYLNIFKKFESPGEDPELQEGVEKIWEDLPVYRKGKTLVYWSHQHLMPWQTQDYYESQAKTLRKNNYIRLHLNYWVSSAEAFIDETMWETALRKFVLPEERGSTYALDGSVNGDLTALVGCKKAGDNTINCNYCNYWTPSLINDDGKPEIDYEAVVEEILRLWRTKALTAPLWYDPYQCSYVAQRLRALGLKCREFPQGNPRVRADTFLYKAFNEGFIYSIPHPMLKQHLLSANVVKVGKDDNLFRMIKPGEESDTEELADGEVRLSQSNIGDAAERKIDCAVALSMSLYQAWHNPSKPGGWGASGKQADRLNNSLRSRFPSIPK